MPIHHTSYGVLFFILALAGATLFLVGASVKAGPPQSSSGDVNLTGIVPGDPPATPAEILVPKDGTHVTDSELTISGTCEPQEFGRMIEVYRQSTFVGSAQCSSTGQFEITITLLPGQNQLIVRTVDWVGQYGPDSDPITVIYDVPSDGGGSSSPGDPSVPGGGSAIPTPAGQSPLQLFIAEHLIKAAGRNKESTFDYRIAGGKAPYAVTVDWGDDSRDDVASLTRAGNFNFKHTYRKAGLYLVTFRAVDSSGNKAIFQILVVVSETAVPGAAGSQICVGAPNSVECYVSDRVANLVDKLWPAFTIAVLMTFSFWFGEKLMYLRHFSRKIRGHKVA